MNCKTCEYTLWNLTTGKCPECGEPFLPSEFEFKPNAVHFCCPHCEQVYFGTTPTGHLHPPEFDCVQCGEHVSMDEMILRPAEGIRETETQADCNPWLERGRRGRFKSWVATIGRVLIAPGRLIKATPPQSSIWQAWWFAIITLLVPVLVMAIPLGVIAILLVGTISPSSGGPNPGTFFGIAGIGVAILLVSVVLGSFIFIGLWGLLIHGLLRLTGPLEQGIGRTYQALCYSAGTSVFNILALCGGQYVSYIWWIVSATIMIKDGHKVHGGRASFAVLSLPLLFIVTIIVGYGFLFFSLLSGSGGFGPGFTDRTAGMTTNIIAYATVHNGRGPDHAIELMSDQGLSSMDYVSWESPTVGEDVPVADLTLADYEIMSAEEKQSAALSFVESQPENLIAHRLGDFVFTYHGIDLNNADPGLWLVILSFDPDSFSVGMGQNFVTVQSTFTVGLADGTTSDLPVATFLTINLPGQNALRASFGLPPLPDPSTVTYGSPAIGTIDP